MKILIAGFKHETNTFAPNLADWNAFLAGEVFPPPTHGQEMLDLIKGINVPMTGFIRAASERDWDVVPSLWCGAVPSSYVTAEAFERIAGTILRDVSHSSYDAVYLDLHGAAMAEGIDDAEGELLQRIRTLVGDQVPIVVSLDLHANVTERMLDLADGLVAYRTYPHLDYVQTGELAAQLLQRRLQVGGREKIANARLNFLIPLSSQCTTVSPAKEIYQSLAEIERESGVMLSFCMGFPSSDFEECAPMIWGYGDLAKDAVQKLTQIANAPPIWRQKVYAARDAVAHAMSRTASSGKPVVIADTQDNPGVGGTGSTTGMLHALLAEGAGRRYQGGVCFGMLYDEDAAAAAAAAGVGAKLELKIGSPVRTWSGLSDPPIVGTFEVKAISDGNIEFKGPKMTGFIARLGPSVCLEIEGILVAVTSAKIGTQDRELFRAVGIEPETMRIIVVKSSMHFRADFEHLVADQGQDVLIAKAAGAMATEPGDLPWKKLSSTIQTRL